MGVENRKRQDPANYHDQCGCEKQSKRDHVPECSLFAENDPNIGAQTYSSERA